MNVALGLDLNYYSPSAMPRVRWHDPKPADHGFSLKLKGIIKSIHVCKVCSGSQAQV